MKKFILLFIILLLSGCSTTTTIQSYTINGNTITFNKEDLTFTLPDNFEVKDNIIKFGPTESVPLPYVGEMDTFKTLALNVVPARGPASIVDSVKNDAENISTLKLKNGIPYVKWYIHGMCTNTYYEIIGQEDNIRITDYSCSSDSTVTNDANNESAQAVKDFLDSVR